MVAAQERSLWQESGDTEDWGVSVVICCHNSAQRLPETLAHLAAQSVEQGLCWEVVIIDNASTDNTAEVARSVWPSDAPAPLRIIHEPALGLSNARRRAFVEARYEVVSFVDDDNWVEPSWVLAASSTMGSHPEVGACGGLIEPVFETAPPPWMECFIRRYAVGAQGDGAGDITQKRGWLWGAGLTIRKEAWESLVQGGFHLLLLGRQGKGLSAGEDVEICWALRLAGWRLWYDPRLHLRHFLPEGRLSWKYLRGLYRGFGEADLGLVPYRYALQPQDRRTLKGRLKRTWQAQLFTSVARLLRHGTAIPSFFLQVEGDAAVLEIERDLGRLQGVVRQRELYNRKIREIENAPWRRLDRETTVWMRRDARAEPTSG